MELPWALPCTYLIMLAVNTSMRLLISFKTMKMKGLVGEKKKGGKGKRVEVETIRNGVVLDESACGGRKKGGNRVIVGVKTEENRVVCNEGFGNKEGRGEMEKRESAMAMK